MTMTMQLADQRIVVMGGTKGIGLGIPRLARNEERTS
jgi:NAD(P)-dependent dehydrogenase (short-subunit alcohol dehydrogenase family)